MRVSFCTFACLLFALHALAQQKPTRLIVRGDDMGYAHSGNEALIRCYTEGIETSIEVIVPSPWFPEAVQLLRQHPGVDVGVHLALTSEWDNVKWRPVSDCRSLKDAKGYFYPMVYPNPNYPGQAILENPWTIADVEKEFRAQIELALRQIPRLSHISGHMNCTGMTPEVAALTLRLAREYQLDYDLGAQGVVPLGYDGSAKTPDERRQGFLKMLETLESGKTYLYVEHPGLNNAELQAIHHIGYEDVAGHRQAVTDIFTSEQVKNRIREKGIELVSYNEVFNALPRSTPQAEGFDPKAVDRYLEAVAKSGQDLHSLMILRHGKVVAERWLGEHAPAKRHILNSVSKTFTATAVGFAVAEKRLRVSDKVISFFPDDLPDSISPYLAALQVRDLLSMTVGHGVDHTGEIRNQTGSWERLFLSFPIEHRPGTKFVYNSLASYMLSAIVQKVSGEPLTDYLYPRLFRPLGITGVEWQSSPSGVNTGGWGLFVTTEDMAKMGQFLLQKGNWEGRQLLPATWFEEATAAHSVQPPQWLSADTKPEDSDWVQGYGYQLWRCRHGAYRADGANGQFIIVLPEQDAVIVTTANIGNMQAEINLIWEYLLPGLR